MPFYREVVSVLEEAEPFVKLLAHSPAHTADEMIAAVPATVKGLAEITQSGDGGLVEISAPGVTKAAALDRVCRAHGVPAGEVVLEPLYG
ncbi:hypothetical protein ACI2LC_04140 [Nonomuraea wenchangensis]|uniref:hypothetical protein n=1 Tax=Nonomuraea wenchangensis TaxID=568860 RepID=UPI0037A49D25